MTITRPVFNDGAILAAGDLSTLEVESRNRDARHARHLHVAGIGAGMELHEEPQTLSTGQTYVDLLVRAGYALDGTGRELVVGKDLPLSADRFRQQNLNPPTEPGQTQTVWHPVFVRGVDTAGDASTATLGCQGAAAGSRIAEDVEIDFGRPGDASLAQQEPPPDAGPGDGSWRVLVGFVRYDTAIGQFVASATSADGVSVAGAGARAGLVAGQFGRVEVRGRASTDSGVPALVVADAPAPSLVFGTHTGSGALAPLFSVDASGNLEIQGALKAQGTAGSVRVVGGVASDGVVLPLPEGVGQATVDSGGIELVVTVTPHLPDTASAPANFDLFVPAECRVDAQRRVHCWGNWVDLGGHTTQATAIGCDYVVLAVVPGGA